MVVLGLMTPHCPCRVGFYGRYSHLLCPPQLLMGMHQLRWASLSEESCLCSESDSFFCTKDLRLDIFIEMSPNTPEFDTRKLDTTAVLC